MLRSKHSKENNIHRLSIFVSSNSDLFVASKNYILMILAPL